MRRGSVVASVLALGLFAASAAHAASGDLTQKPGTAGCVSTSGTGGLCQSAPAASLNGAAGVAVSPDGASVYVASQFSDTIAIFDRDPATGALTQKPGAAGCVAETVGLDPCQDGKALDGAFDIAVSPDGKSVYVASLFSDAVAILDRDTSVGASHGTLTQESDTAGCVSDTGTGGACQNGEALDTAQGVAVSPDGSSVYVGAGGVGSNGIAIFDRNAANSDLTQKSGTAGCVTESGSAGLCQDGKALALAGAVTVSPDDKSVYVASFGSDAVAIFDRDTGGGVTNGALTQKAGTAGCVSDDGSAGECQDGVALNGAGGVTVSPDGKSVYTGASENADAVSIFDRDTSGGAGHGALTQKAGTAGCVSDSGTAGACQDGKALNDTRNVVVTPDGASVYAVSGSGGTAGAITIFDRAATGALTQKAGTAGCVSEDGTSGTCQDGVALIEARDLAVSPNGRSVYVSAHTSSALSIFDREPVKISIDDLSVTEGNSGQTAANFTVSLDTPVSQQVTVDYATSDGTATAPSDYASASGTATFDPADTAEPVTVLVEGDTADEPAETFEVDLSNPTIAAIADGLGVGTILDDDVPAAAPEPGPDAGDVTAPDTQITERPKEKSTKKAAEFEFASSEPSSSFECSLDDEPFEACASPHDVKVKKGKHTFAVRAKDAAGNADPTPATDSWKVRKPKK